MKVTLINRDDSGGGAAMACRRLFDSLSASNAEIKMLVQEKTLEKEGVYSTVDTSFDRIKAKFNFLYERLSFIPKEREKSVRFAFSTANAGTDISRHPAITDSDVLHLHWINGGFMSLGNLDKLLSLKKPVVWTLHDMWPFTGGCHYPGESEKFLKQCGECHFLKNPHPNDISRKGWLKKNAIYSKNRNLTFVACSNWMREEAEKSSLLRDFEITTIPNPIDINLYSKRDKVLARKLWGLAQDSKVILFGAANINHVRKGSKYLIDALHKIKQSTSAISEQLQLVVFGKSAGFDFNQIPFPVVSLPVIKNENDLAEIYSLADVFVLPSLEDNLPNMVMEALACSTPVVAFNSGGINDLVNHNENGYLAEYKSAEDLAQGILTVLGSESDRLSLNARRGVVEKFNYETVASQHLSLYEKLLSQQK